MKAGSPWRRPPPTARVISRIERVNYAKRAHRVVIRHGRGKSSRSRDPLSGEQGQPRSLRSFVEKAADILNQGVNLLVVDLFPPTPRPPGHSQGHLGRTRRRAVRAPPGKPLIVASYVGGDIPTAYVESVGVGDALPSLPIFLSQTRYIPAPLETTYQEAWAVFPAMLKELIEPTGK